eukprot:TRINITY_DN5800_c0_g1_i6.p1 TRINITY_DN5800_c0_g1~~TRINITY_DN5800_c0_g1_i6.p1  ORF type:complete len:413 (-),score=101.43 TRINITY_DN5800_c0_g1_i6:146-1384(-)
MIRRPPRSTLSSSSAASDVYKRQVGRSLWSSPKMMAYLASADGGTDRVFQFRMGCVICSLLYFEISASTLSTLLIHHLLVSAIMASMCGVQFAAIALMVSGNLVAVFGFRREMWAFRSSHDERQKHHHDRTMTEFKSTCNRLLCGVMESGDPFSKQTAVRLNQLHELMQPRDLLEGIPLPDSAAAFEGVFRAALGVDDVERCKPTGCLECCRPTIGFEIPANELNPKTKPPRKPRHPDMLGSASLLGGGMGGGMEMDEDPLAALGAALLHPVGIANDAVKPEGEAADLSKGWGWLHGESMHPKLLEEWVCDAKEYPWWNERAAAPEPPTTPPEVLPPKPVRQSFNVQQPCPSPLPSPRSHLDLQLDNPDTEKNHPPAPSPQSQPGFSIAALKPHRPELQNCLLYTSPSPRDS